MNIRYTTDEMVAYYTTHRRSWTEFYPSERTAFEHAAGPDRSLGTVLDAGCGGGGLGLALCERFRLEQYTGVDIHEGLIQAARERNVYPCPARLVAADILQTQGLAPESFDTVVSLSCADWNLDTVAILESCWSRVRPGGRFVLTLRLTPDGEARDFATSYQYIHFGDAPPLSVEHLEKAPYVVFNAHQAFDLLRGLHPAEIFASGYWGPPSQTAVTPFERLVFAALVLTKPRASDPAASPTLRLDLPDEALPHSS
ncbi:hypothetical protein JCM15519_17640 [Fundidesulfovibrio butyratiphilus]